MTDDERHGEESREETEESPDQDTEPPEEEAMSRADPETRWGDPENRWGDPEVDLPNIPRVHIPGEESEESLKSEFSDDAPEFTADIDPEQSRLFWASVVLANIGLAAIALGPMLIYFRGQTLIGLGVTLLGVAALARVYKTYQEYQNREWPDDEDESDDAEGDAETDADVSGFDAETDADERNR